MNDAVESGVIDSNVVTDEFINEIFKGTCFGSIIDNSVEEKKKQLAKTLRDQMNGYWSGHTAYHIAVNGGFLVDAKSSTKKQLTPKGIAFMRSMSAAA